MFLPVSTAVLVAIGSVMLTFAGNQSSSDSCSTKFEVCPSLVQLRVDRSFSVFGINETVGIYDGSEVVFGSDVIAAGGFTELRDGSCENWNECYLRDTNGVQHSLFGTPDDLYVVTKAVHARDFVGRPIPALGIGTARNREDVIANVRRFVAPVELDCHNPPNVVDCHAHLSPGWIEITFDIDGQFIETNFAGYHFI